MAEQKEKKSRLLGAGEIDVSFEFFPAQDGQDGGAAVGLRQAARTACARVVSVTYGAGGSTRERTHATVSRIIKETALRPAAHLTCVNATKDGDQRGRARLLGGRRPPHRRLARRPA